MTRSTIPPIEVGDRLSRSEVLARKGMVCSVSPLAASVGLKVLMNGGNAFDAAIAVAATEVVTLPSMCGLGGDVFALLYHAPSTKILGINGSGSAPTGATPDFFRSLGHNIMPQDGPLSISIPGEVGAWATIHSRFCTWPMEKLLEPAIGYAMEGFPLPLRTGDTFVNSALQLGKYPSTAAVFLKDGQPYRPGDVLVNRDLGSSLERIASGGAEEFYLRELARRMVKGLREAGALFTEEDFARYRTEVYEEPLSTSYRGYTAYQTRPPSQGFIMLEMLNLLEGFDLASLGHLSAESIHLMVEAKKLAFADRNLHLGDPAFVTSPLGRLISKEYSQERRSLIDPSRASEEMKADVLAEADGDTSYFCVADGEGNCVSFIHSIYKQFGSAFVAEGTGIVFNNRAAGFSLEEGHPNVIAPGKRTMHTLNCYMVFRDSRPWLVGGTPGADFQPQGNTQIITSISDFGLGLQQAIEAPRWWSVPGTDVTLMGQPFELRVEDGMPQDTIDGLQGKGHRVVRQGPGEFSGRVQLIRFDHERGVMMGASDPRGDGHAVGF